MLLSDWLAQVKEHLEGKVEEIRIRHARGTRDFVNVRDAAAAIALAACATCELPSILNVASGRATPTRHLLVELERVTGRPKPLRGTEACNAADDVAGQIGTWSLSNSVLGWSLKVSLHQTVADA